MFSLVVAARIVCCFAAVPQRVQKCCTICDTQPTTRVQLKWHWGDTQARARTARGETNGTDQLRLRVRYSDASSKSLPPPMDARLRGPWAPQELLLEHRPGHVPGGARRAPLHVAVLAAFALRTSRPREEPEAKVTVRRLGHLHVDRGLVQGVLQLRHQRALRAHKVVVVLVAFRADGAKADVAQPSGRVIL